MAAQAGYSGTPLAQKLGLKDGQAVAFVGLPDGLGDLAESRAFAEVRLVAAVEDLGEALFDLIHIFVTRAETLVQGLMRLQDRIVQNGAIWVSWPKKVSKVPTDVTEDVIRAEALKLKLVDVKVCAVSDIWSGLKLVIRKELRT